MRELKFRAWDNVSQKMMFRSVWDRNWYATPKNDKKGCHCLDGVSPDDKYQMELMQYTGLKDKNGKEIYEGDVLFTNGINMKVKWISAKACFSLEGKHRFVDIMWFTENEMSKNSEVIGNVFENPELLSQNKKG